MCLYGHSQEFLLPCVAQEIFCHSRLWQQRPWSRQSRMPFPASLLSSPWRTHTAESGEWHPWKTTTITQWATCSLTLSLLVFLSHTEWKYKRRNANVPCSQAQIAVQQATVRSLWSFSKPEKHMKNICTGSHKGRLDTSAVWLTGTKESSSLWNFRSFDTEKRLLLLPKEKNLWNTNSLIFKQA